MIAEAPAGYWDAVNDRAACWLPGETALRLTGADRLDWLQGQVTQDLRGMADGDTRELCFVKPTGQIESYGVLYAEQESVLLITDRPDPVMRRVAEMVILEDVSAQIVAQSIWTVQGPNAVGALRRDRSGPGGYDVIAPIDSPILSNLPQLSIEALDVLGLEFGLPQAGVDYLDRTLPPELGAAFERRTCHYNKGCYTGQEVLMRLHSRGHTNKTWVTMLVEAPASRGAAVRFEGAEVGTVSRTLWSPRLGHMASATVLNRASMPLASVQVGSTVGFVR